MNNPYSKYRYDNNFSVKVRTDASGSIIDVFGLGSRADGADVKNKLCGTKAAAYGTTTIVNYIYKVERVNIVDNDLVSPAYKGPTRFKPF